MNRSQTIFVGGLGVLVFSSIVAFSQSRPATLGTIPVQSDALMPAPSPTMSQAVLSPAPLPIAPSSPPQPAVELTAPPPSSPAITLEPALIASDYPAHRITTCNGQPASANFRAAPSLAQTALVGAVQHGELVYLTGQMAGGDGVLWYEAIAPTLSPIPAQPAQFHPNASQTGWIASCFVNE